MGRWLLLAACVLAWSTMGCASSAAQAGLANAPALSGTGPTDGIGDVIANGRESCGRNGDDGPLRHRWPACENEAHPTASQIVPSWLVGGRPSVVVPWLERFYVDWSCRHAPREESPQVAWAMSTQEPASCETH